MPILDNAGLATLLRECASLVERNAISPILVKGAEALQVYHDENYSKSMNGTTATPITTTNANTNTKTNTNTITNTNITNNTPNNNPPVSKPYFQRPSSKSILIANGWIEQQRNSRLKIIWKEILASLVEARRPGEETTLWIQREIRNPQNKNKTELEALHQIPMKWIEEVSYIDFHVDFRFSIKVFNVKEDFVFRTGTEESCKQWVATLKSARDGSYIAVGSTPGGMDAVDQASASPRRRAEHSRSEHSPDRLAKTSHPRGRRQHEQKMHEQQQQRPPSVEPGGKVRMSIKELRAIAHGAGQDTRGMERADLEQIAEHYAPASARYPAPNVGANAHGQPSQQHPQPQRDGAAPKRSDSITSVASGNAAAAAAPADEVGNNRTDVEQEEELLRQQEVYLQRKRAEAAKQNNDDILQSIKEQAAAKAAAEQEQKRQKEEEEMKRRADFAKQWSGKNSSAEPDRFGQGWRGPGAATPPTSNATTPPFQQQQAPPPPQQHQQQQQPPQTGDPTSPIHHKYAKAVQSEKGGDDEATISAIKRNVLIHWALMPPKYNMLRPIDHLLCAIHTVFPPAFGVAQHSYFTRWRQINAPDLVMSSAMGNSPDENKLKKAVRKLRVFLHPDRLPRDFNAEHTFVCKMLWDVSNDAWEEFMKHKDDLDWVHK